MFPLHIRNGFTAFTHIPIQYGFFLMFLVCVSLTLLGCDPEDLINNYFRQMGLTRLAVLQRSCQ
jgi:hypothetical protein